MTGLRTPRPWRRLRRALPALVALGLVAGPVTVAPAASSPDPVSPSSSTTAPPLHLGVYPGGPAGTVAGGPKPLPEDPQARGARLAELAAGGPFGVHLYTAFTGDAAADERTAVWLDGEIAGYAAAGLDVELVVRYEPAGGAAAPEAYASSLRATVRRYAATPALRSLQVTNEANLPGQPGASDGAFPGVVQALVQGVVAAGDEADRLGRDDLQIGFNWASDARPAHAADFFAALGAAGGAAFARAVDWVGLDAYPGTWYPALSPGDDLPARAAAAMRDAIRTLRLQLMPRAGLGADVAVHVSETGFPTGADRSEATQADVLEAVVRQVDAVSGTYGVTDLFWFDLRDSRTADPGMESHYGLLRDDHSPKPAFFRFRDLVAELRTPALAAPGSAREVVATAAAERAPSAARATRCSARSRVALRVPRVGRARVVTVTVRRGRRVLASVRRRVPGVVAVRLPAGRSRLVVRVQAAGAGVKARSREVRRTVVVCPGVRA